VPEDDKNTPVSDSLPAPEPGRRKTADGEDNERAYLPRWLIRVVVGLLGTLCIAFALLARAPDRLPSLALGQEVIYRLELLVGSLFASLLVATPLLQGVINGRLPTEITTRGAKYDPEEVSASLGALEERILDIEAATTNSGGQGIQLRADVAELRSDLAELKASARPTPGADPG
jgi:hypothetical protein